MREKALFLFCQGVSKIGCFCFIFIYLFAVLKGSLRDWRPVYFVWPSPLSFSLPLFLLKWEVWTDQALGALVGAGSGLAPPSWSGPSGSLTNLYSNRFFLSQLGLDFKGLLWWDRCRRERSSSRGFSVSQAQWTGRTYCREWFLACHVWEGLLGPQGPGPD